MSFHDALKAARTAAGLTQYQMAQQLGLDKTTYNGYESGRRQPDLQKLRRMVQLLQVSADQLLETGAPGAVSPQELALLRKYRLLDLHGRELAELILNKEYVRVNGRSMEPAYRDGDIVFVERTEAVHEGETGIFFLNGDGYIKRLGHGELLSLNPEYGPIPLAEFDDFRCQGRVLGKLP